MARPKKGTPGDAEAGERWRKTITEKYGSVAEFMARVGRKGGSVCGTKGGFAADNERARRAGALGGSHSRRGYTLVDKDEKSLHYIHNESGKIVEVAR